MINGGKDTSLIKSNKSPSNILPAVFDRQAKNFYLQKKENKKLLGDRVELYDPNCIKNKNFIILGGGQGVHPKRTESVGSRDGRNSSLSGQKVSDVLSAGTCTLTAAQNSVFIENGLKYTERIVGIFSIQNSRLFLRYSSTEGGDSRGLTVAHRVDSEAHDICGTIKLQFQSEGRSVSSEVLAMRHSICSICSVKYFNGKADLLVVTCSHATARIILLVIMLHAFVCHFYIYCISILLSVTPYCYPDVHDYRIFVEIRVVGN